MEDNRYTIRLLKKKELAKIAHEKNIKLSVLINKLMDYYINNKDNIKLL